MFGIDGGEFVVLALLALFLIGPERLPGLAQQAARALHDLRRWTQRTRDDIGRELGPEFENFDLADLNPRRFVQKHLFDPLTDGDDDERPLVPQVHGHASLASRGADTDATDSAVLAAQGSAGAGGGPTVSLSKALGGDLDGGDSADGAGHPQPIGPRISTDVFAEPRVVTAGTAARTAVAVPAWGDTASARADPYDDHPGAVGGRRPGGATALGIAGDPGAAADGTFDGGQFDGGQFDSSQFDGDQFDGGGSQADADGADTSWAAAFYLAPVFDTEAT